MKKVKVIRTKIKNGKIIRDGIEEDHYINTERIVLFGKDSQFIIVDKDCCHEIYDSRMKSSIAQNQYMGSKPIPDMPYTEFMERLEEKEIDLREWIHYFGVKPRIDSNYAILKTNCKELGIDISSFPRW